MRNKEINMHSSESEIQDAIKKVIEFENLFNSQAKEFEDKNGLKMMIRLGKYTDEESEKIPCMGKINFYLILTS